MFLYLFVMSELLKKKKKNGLLEKKNILRKTSKSKRPEKSEGNVYCIFEEFV